MRAMPAQREFVPIIGLLIGTAWATLLLWAQGPYGRYLDHGRWTELGVAADICRALPGGNVLLPAFLYIGGWLLMTAAMMLPTVLPLLRRPKWNAFLLGGHHDGFCVGCCWAIMLLMFVVGTGNVG